MEENMNNNTEHRSPMGIFESIFDLTYLAFDLIAGLIFLFSADGRKIFLLYGLLALLLGGGDAFHLIPRVRRHLKGDEPHTERNLGLGLAVSSITMTIYYLVLYAIYTCQYSYRNNVLLAVMVICAVLRIVLCLFPQNNWFHYEGSPKWSLYRNFPFAIVGIVMIIFYLAAGTSFGVHMTIAILISFGCYIPVTIFAKKIPAIGALMMPKTLAYVWMIAMGLSLL
jgi:hypothetical protein